MIPAARTTALWPNTLHPRGSGTLDSLNVIMLAISSEPMKTTARAR